MNKLLIRPISIALSSFAMKPVVVAPIATLAKPNIYYNFATQKQNDGDKKNVDKKQNEAKEDKSKSHPAKAAEDKKAADIKLNISKKSNWENEGGATVTPTVESKDKKEGDKIVNKQDNLNKHKKQGQQLNAEKKTNDPKQAVPKSYAYTPRKDNLPDWQRDDRFDPKVQNDFRPREKDQRDQKYNNKFTDRIVKDEKHQLK